MHNTTSLVWSARELQLPNAAATCGHTWRGGACTALINASMRQRTHAMQKQLHQTDLSNGIRVLRIRLHSWPCKAADMNEYTERDSCGQHHRHHCAANVIGSNCRNRNAQRKVIILGTLCVNSQLALRRPSCQSTTRSSLCMHITIMTIPKTNHYAEPHTSS